ncbi:acetyl-CoA synthetase-like protein [Rickenella mellea]|uniref:Acetyl-CoA synthetase-like protein n=1 Tax=Rickenella mellea TaxID=50990 RepID=A0A4Y7PTA7_9AGAM|nr:acetyl-CoA synthetase-like protein [Rickenella mellea]
MYIQSPFPPLPPVPQTNLFNVLLRRPDQAQWPDHTMYADGLTGRKVSFLQHVDRALDAATALSTPEAEGGVGITDGELVGIFSENCLDYIVLVHALLAITVPFSLFPSQPTSLELEHVLNTTKVTCVFVQPELLTGSIEAFRRANIPDDRIYILEGSSQGKLSLGDLIDRVRTSRIPRVSVREPKKDCLAYLVFSSGTSGLPKAVMISQDNVRFAIYQAIVVTMSIREVYEPPPPPTPHGFPVALSILPFYHSYGLHFTMFRTLLPSVVVVLPRWDMDLAIDIIQKHRVTMASFVPSLIHQLVNSPKFKKADLSSIQSMLSGAAYLPPQLADKLTSLTNPAAILAEGYGMSEGTISAMTKPIPGLLDGRFDPLPKCTGVLIAGVEARVVREDGSEAGFDEPGELLIRGGNVALGYWGNEEATEETFLPYGWLKTGDRFRVDKKGIFYFEDRGKDTLKVSGHQVSPKEIEVVLLAHPENLLVDASVAGVPGGRTSDEKVPRAWVVLSDEGKRLGANSVQRKLKAWTQKSLSKYKWLRGGIEIVDEIPKSPTGKVLRRVLQERYAQSLSTQSKL